ncbi:MAG: ATP-binding cassette domain-containing protein [Bacteroidales bacterium]|nr:ATP-binding cassette domain-containing protein [Bacteroidales bacterium]
MHIKLLKVKPTYMSESEIDGSDIYLSDFVIEKNKFYLVKGRSGSGKTSLLNFIFGKSLSFNGDIFYDEINTKSIKDYSVFRLSKISYVFQDLKLFDKLTAYENIQLKNNLLNTVDEVQIDNWFKDLNIFEKKHSLVSTMSLGERQRVAIIRAICQPYEVLLLDEPFSHIDKNNIKKASEIIVKRTKEQNATLLLATLDDEYLFEFDVKKKL